MNYCGGDEEFYYTLLTQLVSESEQKHSNLDRFLAERDFRNYEILIHALKTTLKMAGSDALSARAKALELAVKEHNETQILDEHGGMMQDYLALIGRIAEICGVQLPAGETAQADEIMEFAPDNTDPDEEIMEFMPEEEGD